MDDEEPISGAVDPVRPWTIKAISAEVRDLAIMAARKENVTVGQWLERRIRDWTADGAAPGNPRPAPDRPHPAGYPDAVSVAELGELVRMLDTLRTMPTRDPERADSLGVPVALKAAALAAIGLRLREARGLPAPAPRQVSKRLITPAPE